MSLKLSYISCNLKNARSLIAKKEKFQIKNSNRYISRHLNRNKPKIEFNNKLFIKSLLSNLNNKKESFFLKQDEFKKNFKLNTIQINKKGNEKNTRYLNNNFPRLRKSQSYVNINEEKTNLIENNIKSNKKFNGIFFDEIYKNQDIIISPKINYRKINPINNNIINPFQNLNKNRKNFSFLVIKNSNQKINNPKKITANNGTIMNNLKVNKSIQSSIDIELRTHKSNNDDYIMNNDLKRNLSATNIFFKKNEYLKFLEKKSLALRANIIVNNIQDNRGGKQDLRRSYNPMDK